MLVLSKELSYAGVIFLKLESLSGEPQRKAVIKSERETVSIKTLREYDV